MQPPNNSRRVLTWARDIQGLEAWQIDSYSINHVTERGFWLEASAWDMKVLYWQELPPKPQYEEGE